MRGHAYWDAHEVARADRAPIAKAPLEQPGLAPWLTVRDALDGLPDPQFDPEGALRFPDHRFMRRPDGSIRYFSIRESARLQTFPDDFLFHGAWGETMRQLGNAVPVRLS